jgi:Putative auto-transporter adhesin, head GIN domain
MVDMKNGKYYFHTIIAWVFILFCLFACSTKDCLHDTGSITKTHIETGYIKTINFNGIFDIYLVQDTVYYIDLEGGNKVLEYVQVQNADSVLSLYNTNSCSFLRDFKKIGVYVHFSQLGLINITEPCNIKSQNVITGNLAIAVGSSIAEADLELNNENFFIYTNKHTAGSYLIKGHCTRCFLWPFYASKIDASNLLAKTMHVRSFSIGDCLVNVEDELFVEIHNSGNVIYKGSPVVQIDSLNGSGRVIKDGSN